MLMPLGHGVVLKDLISHLWIPMIVLGTSWCRGLIELCGPTFDELGKLYVVASTGRKGMPEWRLLLKYPAEDRT